MLSLCLEHFNERLGEALTEQDVLFRMAVCEVCHEMKPCVLSYNADTICHATLNVPDSAAANRDRRD